MTQQHPITPPPELVQQWRVEAANRQYVSLEFDEYIAEEAAQYGADQELEACCALMDDWGLDGEDLMQCRRPKPPSLKEQSITLIDRIQAAKEAWDISELETIRRALEQLPDNA